MKQLSVDIAIVGAGLVGLSAAIALHEAGHEVLVIDRHDPFERFQQSQDASIWDSRIYAISPNNALWLATLGVWKLLDQTRITKMQGMALWGDASSAPLNLSANDVNANGLGYIVEAGALMAALLSKLKALNVPTLFQHTCAHIQTNTMQSVISLKKDTLATTVTAKLLLAADGVHSWVRSQLNFAIKNKAYDHTAVVANFQTSKSHQHIARQWFRKHDDQALHILAWLPLPENRISIVWSVPPTVADQLMAMDTAMFEKTVSDAGEHALGDLQLITAPATFPLNLNLVYSPVKETVVLLGDAAHQVHPMAGQGVNLGFRDVVSLVETLNKKHHYQQINDMQLLKQYERVRKVDVTKMVVLTDGLYQTFNSQLSLVKKVRHWGFETTKYQYLKDLLVKQAINM